MKTKCLIVDDEPLAIELIETHISQMDSFEVVATSHNAIKAFEILKTQTIDLIFLDIQMPMMTGIDFIKTLKNPPKVIITTAYRDYAVEGYELDIVDYLLKPITFERFFRAIEKYHQLTQKNTVIQKETVNIKSEDDEAFIYVKSNKKHIKIYLKDLLYVESLKDYIKIFTTDESIIVVKQKISLVEEKLPDAQFLRVHRSFLVNKKYISAFTANDLEINNTEIPIGISYKQKVFEELDIENSI